MLYRYCRKIWIAFSLILVGVHSQAEQKAERKLITLLFATDSNSIWIPYTSIMSDTWLYIYPKLLSHIKMGFRTELDDIIPQIRSSEFHYKELELCLLICKMEHSQCINMKTLKMKWITKTQLVFRSAGVISLV